MALGVLAMAPNPASACSLALPDEHQIDPDAGDVEAPGAPEVLTTGITRGNGCVGGDSCADIGFVTLVMAPVSDDQTAPEDIGYRLTIVSGGLPGDDFLPAYDFRPFGDEIVLTWIDGAENQQEPMALTVEIIAVDGAGNESVPVRVDIADPGGMGTCPPEPPDPIEPPDPDDGFACAVSVQPHRDGLPLLLLALGALWLAGRRRRR